MVGLKYFWSDAWGFQTRVEGIIFSDYRCSVERNGDYLYMTDWSPALSSLSAGIVYRKNVGRFSFQPFLSVGAGFFTSGH
jgi:hypothetical protein